LVDPATSSSAKITVFMLDKQNNEAGENNRPKRNDGKKRNETNISGVITYENILCAIS